MSLDQEIERTVAKLLGSEKDPAEILRAFAERVRGTPVERVVEQHTCSACGEEDVLCFGCKANEVLGEKVVLAAPVLLPKLAAFAKQEIGAALARRRARKAAERSAAEREAAQQQAGAQGWPGSRPPPPPPPGRQTF